MDLCLWLLYYISYILGQFYAKVVSIINNIHTY